MIVDFLMQIAISFFNWIISLMPNFTGLPSGISTAFTTFDTYWDKGSLVFPLDTLFQILALMISIEIGIFVWRMFWFSYNKIPGKFT